MKRHFGIQEGAFSGKINVGLLDHKNTEFLAGYDIFDVDGDGELMPGMEDWLLRLQHEDCTGMAIRVVAEHILKHYSGDLTIDYDDGAGYSITVHKTSDAIGDADADANKTSGEGQSPQ